VGLIKDDQTAKGTFGSSPLDDILDVFRPRQPRNDLFETTGTDEQIVRQKETSLFRSAEARTVPVAQEVRPVMDGNVHTHIAQIPLGVLHQLATDRQPHMSRSASTTRVSDHGRDLPSLANAGAVAEKKASSGGGLGQKLIFPPGMIHPSMSLYGEQGALELEGRQCEAIVVVVVFCQ
jgi:hypothetical protein